jgi:hypothetical protein
MALSLLFVCIVFNDFVGNSDYIAWRFGWQGIINRGRGGRIGRKQLWPNLGYYPGMCLEGLRKFTKIPVRMFCVPADFLN